MTRPGLKFPAVPSMHPNPSTGRTMLLIAAPPINGNRKEYHLGVNRATWLCPGAALRGVFRLYNY